MKQSIAFSIAAALGLMTIATEGLRPITGWSFLPATLFLIVCACAQRLDAERPASWVYLGAIISGSTNGFLFGVGFGIWFFAEKWSDPSFSSLIGSGIATGAALGFCFPKTVNGIGIFAVLPSPF